MVRLSGMTRTSFIELFHNIRKTKVAFISILVFVALGVGIFLGVSWVGSALLNSCELFSNSNNMHDIEIQFPLGLEEEDIDMLRSLDGVEDAEGIRFTYDYLTLGNSIYQAKIMQVSNKIDRLYVVEGRTPSKLGEIAIDVDFAQTKNVNIGDKIVFNELTNDMGVGLNTYDYEVVGIVVNSAYACNSQIIYGVAPNNGMSVDGIMYIAKESFSEEGYIGINDVYITGSDLRGYATQSDEYKEASEQLRQKISDSSQDVLEKRKDAVADAQNQIQAKLNDAKKQLDDGQAKLDEGQRKLDEAKDEIKSGEQELLDGNKKLEEGKIAIEEGENKLHNLKAQIDNGAKAISNAEAEYSGKLDEWLVGYNELEAAKTKLQEGIDEYNYGKCQLDGVKRDLAIIENDYEVANRLINGVLDGSINDSNYKEYLESNNVYEEIKLAEKIIDKYKSTYDINYNFAGIIREAIDEIGDSEDEESFEEFAKRLANVATTRTREILESIYDKIKLAENELNAGLDKIHEAQAQINEGQRVIDDGKYKLDEARREIDDNKAKLDQGQAIYNNGIIELNSKKKEFEQGQGVLEEKTQELTDAKSQIATKEKELEENRNRLSEARKEYESKLSQVNGSDMLENLTASNGYLVQSRSSLIFLNSISVINDITNKLRFSLAGLFVVIGMLVCYSAITRIIYSQIKSIGTKKALGFKTREILEYYLLYVNISALVGIIIGIAIAFGCEKVLLNAVGNSFPFDRFVMHYSVLDIVIVAIVQMLLLSIIAVFASISMLKKRAIELLVGVENNKGKQHFYEKLAIWNRLKLFNKIIVNNFVTDKRRIIGTLIGIAGCTSLIVTALTFSRNVEKSFNVQFGDYFHFNRIVYFDDEISSDAQRKIVEILEKYNVQNTAVQSKWALLEDPDGKKLALTTFTPCDDSYYENMIDLRVARQAGGDNPYEGAWLDYAYWNYYRDRDDNEIEVTTVEGQSVNVILDGYINSYLTSGLMVISSASYEKQFGDKAEANAILCDFEGNDFGLIEGELLDVPGYIKTDDYYTQSAYSFKMFKNLSTAMVVLYIVLSSVMSVIVLLNLLNQFIDEKRCELIVMLVNGFDIKDCRRYIYGDTILLAVIGIILGVAFGCFMGHVSVASFDSAMVYLIKEPDLISCVTGAVGASILTFIMCVIALRKIDTFTLTELTK